MPPPSQWASTPTAAAAAASSEKQTQTERKFRLVASSLCVNIRRKFVKMNTLNSRRCRSHQNSHSESKTAGARCRSRASSPLDFDTLWRRWVGTWGRGLTDHGKSEHERRRREEKMTYYNDCNNVPGSAGQQPRADADGRRGRPYAPVGHIPPTPRHGSPSAHRQTLNAHIRLPGAHPPRP